ncbi:decapping and exoribonuclease protein-like [Chironomus tepperi]|uniref:decapping and exoribonuclease protein-like n=1 Tax=Chironomus tepperi TaxID=113505 RepID=UPI00391F69CB
MSNVTLSDPVIIGAYSLDGDRKYKNDLSALKYLKIPNFKKNSINLNEGNYKDKDKKYDTMERIKQMTSYIMDNSENVMKNRIIDADFVCFRGALKNLMMTPYSKYPNWIVKAVKFKGTIYFIIETNFNDYKVNLKVDDKSYQYGFKFESYILSSDPEDNPKGKSETVNENEEFCILMSRTIDNSIKILFGIESDGVDGNKVNSLDDLKKSKLVEVKTFFDKGTPMNDYTKLGWWCQSYIAAIDQIHVGLRDSRGFVTGIKAVNLKELEDSTKRNNCLKFLKKFLIEIKGKMKDVDDPKKVYCFKWNQKQMKVDAYLDKNDVFLSDNYVNFMNDLI